MRRFLAGMFAVGLSATTWAQTSEPANEEVIEISPFEVSMSKPTRPSPDQTMSGPSVDRMIAPTLVVDPRSRFDAEVPVSLFKRADAVVVQFVLSNASDKQLTRNRELYSSVEAIEALVKNAEGLRMEQREVRLTGGDRKLFSSSKGGSTVSFASLVIFADLAPGVKVVDRVKQVRDLLDSAKIVGQTKALDGSVGLYIKNPEQYRREILQKIFDDLAFVGKGLGSDFQVKPSGLNERVRVRVSAEAQMELWIDYSFTIQSIREIEREKPGK